MARTLTPERQKLKQEAISLRYDYGLTERRIVDQLNLPKTTIHQWLVYNSHTGLVYNIQHLEGDCLASFMYLQFDKLPPDIIVACSNRAYSLF